LAILIAFGMFVAALSDIITERATLGASAWVILVGLGVIGTLGMLHRAAHDEFVKHIRADWELFLGSVLVSVGLVFVGTFLKSTIWYNRIVGEE
jgi:hydrogenase/urease accessory protein HupE